jgi:hypothetical protein
VKKADHYERTIRDSRVSTSFGDDCGEGLVQSPWERSRFAHNANTLAASLAPRVVASASTNR